MTQDQPPRDRSHPSTVINAQSTLRLLVGLLALWTLLSGLTLTFFQDASAATIGGGLKGGEGEAAQRLLGVHLLVLAPIYGLLAWEPQRFRLLLWVPYAAQTGVVAAMAFDLVTGARDFTDAALPLIVALIFLVLLLYVTFGAREPEPVPPQAVETSPAPAPQPEPEPLHEISQDQPEPGAPEPDAGPT
jgi:hypothetical protein